jgi:hypothetical protein
VTLTSSFQKMNTGSALYSGTGTGIPGIGGSNPGTGGVGGVIGGGGTGLGSYYGFAQQSDLTIFTTRADYPIGGGKTLFLEWQALDSQSPLSTTGDGGTSSTSNIGGFRYSANTRRSVGSIGMDVRLTEILGLTLQANMVHLKDKDDSRYSYRARTFNADLSARF